jgi:hypothetical protein
MRAGCLLADKANYLNRVVLCAYSNPNGRSRSNFRKEQDSASKGRGCGPLSNRRRGFYVENSAKNVGKRYAERLKYA